MDSRFRWQDGERLIVFGRGAGADAGDLLEPGYALLSTPRASAAAPGVVAGAGSLHEVGPGRVDELAGALRAEVDGRWLVALGGGRVIDVAKALAAADPPRTVAAIPTTLSGAEMTAVHRHAAGVGSDTARVRPALVINDPALSASQPLPELAQSAANALGHAAEGPLTPRGNPVATLAALEAARLLAGAFASPGSSAEDPGARDALALAALLAGYVIGSTGYGLHHVLAQTLARFTDVGHGGANALVLPHSLRALRSRAPGFIGQLEVALGQDPPTFAERLLALTGTPSLRVAGVTQAQLDQCAQEAVGRPELHLTPPAADRDELRALYRAAY
jgi:alcohol dehydrogenase class IV